MKTFIRFFVRTLLALISVLVIGLVVFRVNALLQENRSAADLKPDNGEFIETSEGTMHVTIWGGGNAMPVVMTHGMAAWGGLWEETGLALAANGYRVIAIDQPPFGFSDREDRTFSRSAQAARLNALAEAMQLDRYLLVGHSYGGGVALETALRFPEKITGLVLVCPVINLAEHGARPTPRPVPLPLRFAWLGETLVAATITNPFMTAFLAKRFMYRKAALTDRHVKILQRPMKLRGNTSYMTVWLQQFFATDETAVSRDRTRLGEASMPISFIWGERDTVTPIAQGEELSAILSPKLFKRLSDTGHMPQLESPALFNEYLQAALEALR